MSERDTSTANGGAAAAGETGDDPFVVLARAGDWATLARLGRFSLAAQTLRLTSVGGRPADPDVAAALAGLADVASAVRAKAVSRARQRFADIDPKPAELVDWAALDADLAALATAVAAVDRREPEVARDALAQLRSGAFLAEQEALAGALAVLEGETGQALAHFEAALVVDPQHVRALTNRGNVRLESGDADGAIDDYQRAIALDDGFANAHHTLGVAYRRKGELGKSVAALRKAQRLAARRDADEARASLRGGGRNRGGGGGWRRWLVIAALVALGYWFLQQRGWI